MAQVRSCRLLNRAKFLGRELRQLDDVEAGTTLKKLEHPVGAQRALVVLMDIDMRAGKIVVVMDAVADKRLFQEELPASHERRAKIQALVGANSPVVQIGDRQNVVQQPPTHRQA